MVMRGLPLESKCVKQMLRGSEINVNSVLVGNGIYAHFKCFLPLGKKSYIFFNLYTPDSAYLQRGR